MQKDMSQESVSGNVPDFDTQDIGAKKAPGKKGPENKEQEKKGTSKSNRKDNAEKPIENLPQADIVLNEDLTSANDI